MNKQPKRQRRLRVRAIMNDPIDTKKLAYALIDLAKMQLQDEAEELSIADVIIEAMPFSNEIIAWCKKHPEVKEALKVANPDNFHALGMAHISIPQSKPEDQVVGLVAYDMTKQKFKQDFLVDLGQRHSEFMLYSKLPSKNYSKYVQHINRFYAVYGKNGDYAGTHHLTLDDVKGWNNPEITRRAEHAVKRSAEIVAAGGRRPISQEELREALKKIRAEKAKQASPSTA